MTIDKSRQLWVALLISFLCIPGQASAGKLPVPLKVHVQLIRALKKKFASQLKKIVSKPVSKAKGLPQTAAYLSVPNLKKQVDISFDLTKYTPLIKSIQDKEKELFDTHYVFYHGQRREFRLMHDVVKEIFKWLDMRGLTKEFEYLRIPGSKFEIGKKLSDFIDEKDKLYHYEKWNDYVMADILLSVNLSLFGNTSMRFGGECTFEFFVTSGNIKGINLTELLKTLFNEYKFNTSYIQELMKAYEATIQTAKEGNLLQIFVPRTSVDEYVYLSHAFGTPYREQIVPGVFNSTKKRHMSIAPVLDLYQQNPQSITGLDKLQARFLMTTDTFLNPDSGIKMYRYTTVEKEVMKTYKKNVKKIVDDIMEEWFANPQNVSGNHSVQRLIRYASVC